MASLQAGGKDNFKMALVSAVIPALLMHFTELADCSKEMRVLQDRLLSNYRVHVRPVLREEDAVEVNMSMYVSYILELDLKTQSLKTSGYMNIEWRDEYLVWQPEEYGNITDLFLPQTYLWLPDLTIENDIRGVTFFGDDRTKVQLRHDGRVTWQPAFLAETGCKVDIYKYPFDRQRCEISVIPMITTNGYAAINYMGPILDGKVTNGEFVLEDTWNREKEYNVTFTSDRSTNGVFVIVLQRRVSFYLLSIVIPVAGLTLLSPLALVVPADSGEKITLSVNVLLAYLVFMSTLSSTIPRVSDSVSIFVLYTTLQIVLSFVAVVVNVASLCLSSKSSATATTTTNNNDINDAATTTSTGEEEEEDERRVFFDTTARSHDTLEKMMSHTHYSRSRNSSSRSRSRSHSSGARRDLECGSQETTRPWRKDSSPGGGWRSTFARFASTREDGLRGRMPARANGNVINTIATADAARSNSTGFRQSREDGSLYGCRCQRLRDERAIADGGAGKSHSGPIGRRDWVCFLGLFSVVVCVNVVTFTLLTL